MSNLPSRDILSIGFPYQPQSYSINSPYYLPSIERNNGLQDAMPRYQRTIQSRRYPSTARSIRQRLRGDNLFKHHYHRVLNNARNESSIPVSSSSSSSLSSSSSQLPSEQPRQLVALQPSYFRRDVSVGRASYDAYFTTRAPVTDSLNFGPDTTRNYLQPFNTRFSSPYGPNPNSAIGACFNSRYPHQAGRSHPQLNITEPIWRRTTADYRDLYHERMLAAKYPYKSKCPK